MADRLDGQLKAALADTEAGVMLAMRAEEESRQVS
jgi:hypothetical protein